MPKLPTNLARIGAVYKFRVRVPKDLLEQYAPKREIVQSLKTKDLAEARRRLPAVQQHYQDEWERLRQKRFEAQLSDAPFVLGRDPLKPKPIDQELIDYATSTLMHDSLAGDEQTRLAGNYTLEEINEYRTGLAEAITQLRDMVSTGDTQSLLPSALQLLQFKGIEAQGSEEDYRRLALAFARSAIQTNEQLLQQLSGNVVEPTPVKVPRTLRKARVPVYSLFTYWRDLVAGRSRQTVDDFEREIRAFEDVVGDKSADELTKADLIAYPRKTSRGFSVTSRSDSWSCTGPAPFVANSSLTDETVAHRHAVASI